MARSYAIRFDYPEGTAYAGFHKGALGWAPTLATAIIFDNPMEANAMLTNGYGASAEWGQVVPVTT